MQKCYVDLYLVRTYDFKFQKNIIALSSFYRAICLMSRVLTNVPGDQGRIIRKIKKIVLDTAFLNTQHYKVRIKGEVEQSRELNSALSLLIVLW